MANKEQLAILRQGVQHWNVWRWAKPSIVRLGHAQLQSGQFGRINFDGADLRAADLSGAILHEADLHRAVLTGAKLVGSDLSEAKLTRVILTNADLREANLWGAYISRAEFQSVNLGGAIMSETTLANVNLASAVGLDLIKHTGPSHVDLGTIKTIPARYRDVFLRGCGLPETYVQYLPSLLDDAIQFYSCFISYATADQEFAERIHADLQAAGVRCWFAPHHMQSGKKVHLRIDEAVRVYDRLLLVVSEQSMKSKWVKTEIANARKKELRQGRQVLFPVRLVDFEVIREWRLFDSDIGDDSAKEIREYFIPDFGNWKDHDRYKKAFDRLLRDLKTAPETSEKGS